MKLVWTERFRNALHCEYDFIRQRNPHAAEQVPDRIIGACRRLSEFPQSGRSWRLPGTLELVIPGLPYIVVYSIKRDEVLILNLFHTSRKFHGHFD
jgi:toxin ParE1/3/4